MGKSHDLATIATDGLPTLEVDTIKNTSGTTALTIDSAGRVLNPNVVAWFLNKTSSQTASGGDELVSWDVVQLNQGSGFQTSGGNANKFVAPVHGIYSSAGTLLTQSDTTDHDIKLFHNSTAVVRTRNVQVTGHETYNFSWVGEMDAGDTLYLTIVTSGRVLYGDTSIYWTNCHGHLVG